MDEEYAQREMYYTYKYLKEAIPNAEVLELGYEVYNNGELIKQYRFNPNYVFESEK